MKSTNIKSFRLIGYIPFAKKLPCFALPVFLNTSGEPEFFVQVVDKIGDLIHGFDLLMGYDTSEILPAKGVVRKRADPQIYCFIDENRSIHTGSLEEIGPYLRNIMPHQVNNTSLYVQLAELVGSLADRGKARAVMQRTIRQSAGMGAASFFYDVSVLHSVLWDAIERCNDDEEALRRIVSKRAQLKVNIVQDSISIDLAAISEKDLGTIDLARVVNIISENHKASQGDWDEVLDLLLAEVEQNDFDYQKLLMDIKKSGRQEDRIVILIDSILRNPDAGRIMFNEYKNDRGKFATWALERLRSLLFLDQGNNIDFDLPKENPREVEYIIASFVPEMYRQIFPMNRGYLIYSFLQHLRWSEAVRAEVLKIVYKSGNSDVAWYVNHFEDKYGPLEIV